MNILQSAVIIGLRVYQTAISPVLAAVVGPAGRCRFTPTCSEYAVQAVRRHGAVLGGVLAVGRLCRCHPWGKFGEDPPPPAPLKFHFSSFKLCKWQCPNFTIFKEDAPSPCPLPPGGRGWREATGEGHFDEIGTLPGKSKACHGS